MLHLKNLSNKYVKRTIRPIYAHTQATPYATSLDTQTLTGSNAASGRTSFKNSDGSRYLPLSGDTSPLNTRTATAATYKNSLVAGVVMVRTVGEKVAVATGLNDGTVEQPFGLLANFVGGDLDDLGDEDSVGVWRGANHAFFEIFAPAFDSTGLSAAFAGAAVSKGAPLKLYAGTDGRLTLGANLSGGSANAATPAVARLVDVPAATRIIVELLV